jgi:hypothetical protein
VPNLAKLIYWVKESRHPVVLAFTSKDNPLADVAALRGYRELFASTNATAWRCDTAGFDAFAGGALAIAMGVLPSLRKGTAPGDQNNARNPKDARPHLLLPELLAHVKTGTLQDVHYANREAPICLCAGHAGRRLDELTASRADKQAGQLHNSITADQVFAGLVDGSSRAEPWRLKRADGIASWESLRVVTGRARLKTPTYLLEWEKLDR